MKQGDGRKLWLNELEDGHSLSQVEKVSFGDRAQW